MCVERWARLILVLACLVVPLSTALAQVTETAPRQSAAELIEERERAEARGERREVPSLDLQMRLKDVQVTTTPRGDVVTVETEEGSVTLTANEYVRALANTKAAVEHGGFLYKLLNISRPLSILWIGIGFLGQALFTFRMILQWWASEKHKRSVVPIGFWWGSLLGGLMLFVYFVWRKDIVGIVGQSTGVFVYARNLILIYRGRRLEAAHAAAPARREAGHAVS